MLRALPLLLLVAGCSGGQGFVPDRIVSNNPCVDAALEQLATPDQIGAVSRLSHNVAAGTASVNWARQFPAIDTSVESVMLTRPRLALLGNFGNTAPLRRAGIHYLSFGVPASIEESVGQVRAIAKSIGRFEQGEAFVSRIDQSTRAAPVSATKSAIIWVSGGFVPGKGTLQDELLARAGFQNASQRYGIKRWDVLPLEALILNPPDVIFMPSSSQGFELRSLALRYQVLAKLSPQPKLVAFPEKLLNCGVGSIIPAMKILRAAA